MDSSFLTFVNVALGIFATYSFLKMVIRYGFPRHPGRLTVYLVCFCVAVYFGMKAAVGLGLVPPFVWLRWRTLPLVTGSLALLLQAITSVGSITLMQQRLLSRFPLITGLLFFAFFPAWADYFLIGSLFVGAIFLSVSVQKARHQRRLYWKMLVFSMAYYVLSLTNNYWLFSLGDALLMGSLFYFFLFEESLAVKAMFEEYSIDEGRTA